MSHLTASAGCSPSRARSRLAANISFRATDRHHPGMLAAVQAEPGPRGRTVPVPGVGRVIVGASGSPGSLRALRYGEVLARAPQAPLVPVIAWEPPGGARGRPVPVLR
jgi:hypothetical protein